MRIRKKNYPSLNLKLYYETRTLYENCRILASRIKHKKRPLFSTSSGPNEVLKSIEIGLGVEGQQIEPFPTGTIWILSGVIPPEVLEGNYQESLLIIGPNVEFHELDKFYIERKFKTIRYLVPSQWVVPVVIQRLDIPKTKVLVWPSGINIKNWSIQGNKSNHALVYLKGPEDQRFKDVIEYLQSISMNYTVVKYGEYSQRFFRKALAKSNFAIWVGGTESQGIAIMESWAMNVPTFVFRKDLYFDFVSHQNYHASAAPYLNDLVGRFSNSEEFNPVELDSFISDLDSFKPREYIEANFGINQALNNLRNQFSL